MFISCLPTKVSQNWFSERERTMTTLVLSLSGPLGLVVGQLLSPHLITRPSQFPLLNTVWVLPALAGLLITLLGVRSSLPPCPPSHSAALARTASKPPFLGTIRQLATNKPFIVMFLILGGAMGYMLTLQTKLEQILCSRGYSDTFAGLSAALIIIAGFIASFPLGYLSMRSGKLILISKVTSLLLALTLGLTLWMFVQPAQEVGLLFTSVLLGIFSLGIYPVMLELSVEATYPLDQSVVSGLCNLSNVLQVSVHILQILHVASEIILIPTTL